MEERNKTVSLFNGPNPIIRTFTTDSEEYNHVGDWIAEQVKNGTAHHEIGVFVRSNKELDRAENALKKARIPYIILDEAAEILSKHPDVTVDVNGYCDIIGGYAYNMRLSDRRSASVARYLESKGISSSHLVTHGYGKTHFVASNRTAEGRAQNRRVELVPVGQ